MFVNHSYLDMAMLKVRIYKVFFIYHLNLCIIFTSKTSGPLELVQNKKCSLLGAAVCFLYFCGLLAYNCILAVKGIANLVLNFINKLT